jgi:hypothetical protein
VGLRRHLIALLLAAVFCAGLVMPPATRAERPTVPLVLIHGQGTGPELTWRHMVPWLQERGYVTGRTLFALDLTGTGAMPPSSGSLPMPPSLRANCAAFRR